MRKIRKGDEIIVLTGKDKGRHGTVTRVSSDNKVLVENINIAKKHQKGDPNRGIPGGIIEKEMPIHISNIALINPQTDKADRVGFKVLEDGRKVRVFKSTGEVVDI
ncbi:MAG: 50S ribosomal protein L24 [Gammaproteobacteria bacterium]|nr:MAG: 50S ribosomal protein L24 [Gammaproteobacteria bacterium]